MHNGRREEVTAQNNTSGYYKYLFGPMVLGVQAEAAVDSQDGNRLENYAEAKYRPKQAVKLPRHPVFERTEDNQFKEKITGLLFSPLCNVCNLTREDSMVQILFEETE